ncbi:MAG: hypothetical protein ACTHQQ_08345 [Solirubrobacteraceae bacterium]
MTPEARAGLLVLATALPPASAVSVPREWLLELLGGPDVRPQAATAPADVTVADLARRFCRQHSTVPAWLERGLFPGAYKFMGGREWRVPPAALAAFEAGQREGKPQNVATRGSTKTVDLGAWRREPEAA